MPGRAGCRAAYRLDFKFAGTGITMEEKRLFVEVSACLVLLRLGFFLMIHCRLRCRTHIF
ncbi:hypothetical protein AJ87_30805 [Rhizobium yanglingense]|nr:hypothetical protein AJ87_30805 [Rhizobium yanglingense]